MELNLHPENRRAFVKPTKADPDGQQLPTPPSLLIIKSRYVITYEVKVVPANTPCFSVAA
jgi:hypothetical protein